MIDLPESPLERAKRLYRPMVDLDEILGFERESASVGRNPEGEDREDGLRAEHEHAVGAEGAETPNPSEEQPQ